MGPTITIKRKVVEEPEEEGTGKRHWGNKTEGSREDALQAIAWGINSMAVVVWAFINDQREWGSKRMSRAVQTVLELSSDEEEAIVKKEKEKGKEKMDEEEEKTR